MCYCSSDAKGCHFLLPQCSNYRPNCRAFVITRATQTLPLRRPEGGHPRRQDTLASLRASSKCYRAHPSPTASRLEPKMSSLPADVRTMRCSDTCFGSRVTQLLSKCTTYRWASVHRSKQKPLIRTKYRATQSFCSVDRRSHLNRDRPLAIAAIYLQGLDQVSTHVVGLK